MATYDLTGWGVQALTPGVARIFVEVLVYPASTQAGQARPTNYYHIGLLRQGVQGAYGPVVPIDASEIFLDLYDGVTDLGYSLFGTGAIRVTEDTPIIPGPDWTLVDTGNLPLSSDFEDVNTGTIALPPGYAHTRFTVAASSGIGSPTAKLVQGDFPPNNLSGDQPVPCDYILDGAIPSDSVQVHMTGSGSGLFAWAVYVSA